MQPDYFRLLGWANEYGTGSLMPSPSISTALGLALLGGGGGQLENGISHDDADMRNGSISPVEFILYIIEKIVKSQNIHTCMIIAIALHPFLTWWFRL